VKASAERRVMALSARTVYMSHPERLLLPETRAAIRAAGVAYRDRYVGNVLNSLQMRGEYALARRVLREVEEALADR
jgi:hypothetical protein